MKGGKRSNQLAKGRDNRGICLELSSFVGGVDGIGDIMRQYRADVIVELVQHILQQIRHCWAIKGSRLYFMTINYLKINFILALIMYYKEEKEDKKKIKIR